VKLCPCHSGEPYKTCCEPRHTKERPAETPEALMRSRYSAFALGLGEYLVDTLSRDHDDRAAPRATLVRELSRVKNTQRFMGLEILAARADGDRGEVTFHAKIFEKGKDRSFTEHSHFVREDGEWRYAFGEPR
jgi:SEC-C motif domain protein